MNDLYWKSVESSAVSGNKVVVGEASHLACNGVLPLVWLANKHPESQPWSHTLLQQCVIYDSALHRREFLRISPLRRSGALIDVVRHGAGTSSLANTVSYHIVACMIDDCLAVDVCTGSAICDAQLLCVFLDLLDMASQ